MADRGKLGRRARRDKGRRGGPPATLPGVKTLLLLAAAVAVGCAARIPPSGAGRWARYEFPEGPPIPGLSHLVLAVPAAAPDGLVWWRLEAFSGDRRRFAVDLQADGLDFLYLGGPAVPVGRYLLTAADGAPVEYVDAATGAALLPKLGVFTHLLPHAAAVADPEMPFFGHGTWLGKAILRTGNGTGAAPVDAGGARRLALDGQVLVGTSRDFRDDGSGPIGRAADGEGEGDGSEYRYLPLSEDDYRAMIDAGFNIFRVPVEHLDRVVDEPVWFLVRDGFDERPDLLFRPNFFGAVMYMDEPAVRAMAFDGLFRELADPRQAAEFVVELTRGRYHGDGGYGRGNLQRLLEADGWDLGGRQLLQPDYPVWETVASAAWYELEAGAAGWCMEARYQPAWFAGLMASELGVDFPADAESTVRFHQALFTGAARRFSARWGVAVYGQMEPEPAALVFPIAYDAGATYFWMWTSDHGHHVPFAAQLAYARALRQHAAAHPRPSAQAPARVAVALPWGYLLDHYQLKHYTGYGEEFAAGRLWWSRRMELTDGNGHGATYGQVLAAAATEASALLRSGTPFDLLFLRPGEAAPAGYDEVRRVSEAGQVTVEAAP